MTIIKKIFENLKTHALKNRFNRLTNGHSDDWNWKEIYQVGKFLEERSKHKELDGEGINVIHVLARASEKLGKYEEAAKLFCGLGNYASYHDKFYNAIRSGNRELMELVFPYADKGENGEAIVLAVQEGHKDYARRLYDNYMKKISGFSIEERRWHLERKLEFAVLVGDEPGIQNAREEISQELVQRASECAETGKKYAEKYAKISEDYIKLSKKCGELTSKKDISKLLRPITGECGKKFEWYDHVGGLYSVISEDR